MVPAEAILAEGVGESNYQASERFRFSVAKRGWICNGASSFPFQGFPLDAWSGPPLAWRGSVDQSFSRRFAMFTQCSNTVFLTSRHGSCHGAPFGTERWQDCLKEASAFAFEPMGHGEVLHCAKCQDMWVTVKMVEDHCSIAEAPLSEMRTKHLKAIWPPPKAITDNNNYWDVKDFDGNSCLAVGGGRCTWHFQCH